MGFRSWKEELQAAISEILKDHEVRQQEKKGKLVRIKNALLDVLIGSFLLLLLFYLLSRCSA